MVKLTSKERKTVNERLNTLCLSRHDSLPIATISGYLESINVQMEDALFVGREGRANIELTRDGSEVNSWLVLYWKKGDVVSSFEVTAYLS